MKTKTPKFTVKFDLKLGGKDRTKKKKEILEIAQILFCKNVDKQTVPSQRTVEEVSLEWLNENILTKDWKWKVTEIHLST